MAADHSAASPQGIRAASRDFADTSHDFADVTLEEAYDDDLLMSDDIDEMPMTGESDFEPMSRGRANTWHGLHVDKSLRPEVSVKLRKVLDCFDLLSEHFVWPKDR